MQYWQSIMQNAQAGTAHDLKSEGNLELTVPMQLPAGSQACEYLPDICWGAGKTAVWHAYALLCF